MLQVETLNLLDIISRGEDSQHQFKTDFTNVNALAAEMVAMSNTQGGQIMIGVNDDGSIHGLSQAAVSRLNQLISNAASQSVKPPINPITKNIATDEGLVLIVQVPEGINRPYMDNTGKIWVKSGADKRHVTAREEMQRMFQAANLVYADELPVIGATVTHLDMEKLARYYQKRFGQSIENLEIDLQQLLNNLGLLSNGTLNLSGLLLFSKNPQQFKPAFMAKAITYPGDQIDINHYLDSEDIGGNLSAMYQQMLAFLRRNLHKRQGKQSINSTGQLEIPEIVLEEILVNALIHRDYFISDAIRLFIFSDRIELISPGHLPNHLTIEQIRYGNSNMRNPRLASHASQILPYRGMGTGIPRVFSAYPDVQIEDNRQSNQLKITIKRL